jgi:hypothetical protein
MAFAPPAGEFRFTMPGASRPITLTISRTDRGAILVYAGRRWVGCLTTAGRFEGRAWVRVALERLTDAHRLHRCRDCGRELSDPESVARGIGPDCYQAQGRRAS